MNSVFKQCTKTMAACGLLMGAIGTSYAVNPYFVGKVTSTIDNDSGAVQMCFKVAGLGNNETIDIVGSGTATATYVCRNAGGNCPDAANKKKMVTRQVKATKPFTSGRYGQVSGCITLNPPSPGSFTCPGNQQVVLSNVIYTNLKVAVVGDGASAAATPPTQSINKGECPAP